MDAVISCAGAAMELGNWGNRVGFERIDYRGNANLLEEARRAGVGRFVYVSLACARELIETEYARAHERFVETLAASGISHTVVRPTGFYGFFVELLRMAWKNRGIVIGDGRAQTNPIHEADVARACVEALTSSRAELTVGGPEVYTRKKLVEIAFAALDRRPRLRSVAPGMMKLPIAVTRLINPRMHALLEFGVAVTQVDVIAPKYGMHRIEDYFQGVIEIAARARRRRPVFRPLPALYGDHHLP
jgi:uncharacterized protein YbjT (DUF2867 family)